MITYYNQQTDPNGPDTPKPDSNPTEPVPPQIPDEPNPYPVIDPPLEPESEPGPGMPGEPSFPEPIPGGPPDVRF
jgi:hypothetical protein